MDQELAAAVKQLAEAIANLALTIQRTRFYPESPYYGGGAVLGGRA
jgi:hypothetical protein